MNKDEIPGINFTGDIHIAGDMFNIHDNQNVSISMSGETAKVAEKNKVEVAEKQTTAEAEDRFHFVHPELDDEEAWRIHRAIKRLVANYRIPEICAYLKEQKLNGKLMLPSNPSVMYSELVRLGMPNGEGFSEKNFSNSYLK